MSHERQSSGELAQDPRTHELEKTEKDYQILRRAAIRVLKESPLYHGPPSLTDPGIIQELSIILDTSNPYMSVAEDFYDALKKQQKEKERFEELNNSANKSEEIDDSDTFRG